MNIYSNISGNVEWNILSEIIPVCKWVWLTDLNDILIVDVYGFDFKILGAGWYWAEIEFPEIPQRPTTVNSDIFPPPWNADEYPERTKGWIAFQKLQAVDPDYYSLGRK